jgi:hypothetical protein
MLGQWPCAAPFGRRKSRPRHLLPPSLASPVALLARTDSTRTSRGLLAAAIPRRPHPSCAASALSHPSLCISRPLTAKRPLASSPIPNTAGMPPRSRPCQCPLGARAGAPWVVPSRAKGARKRGRMLVVLARRRLPPRRPESINQASSPICYKCMFQVFQIF